MGFRSALRRLSPFVDPSRLEYGIASSVVIGALSLVDPARLTPGWRIAFRAAVAGLTGALTLLELRRTPASEGDPAEFGWRVGHREVASGGIVVGVAGTVFGLSELSENLDARLMSGLTRAGVRRPRLLLAAVSTLASIAAYLAVVTDVDAASDDSVDGPRYAAVDPAVRDLVEGMLAATDGYGARELRAHWATARVELWSDEDEAGVFSRWLEFAVDEDLPRAIPHDTTFPVRARFVTPAGVPVEAFLLVSGGRPRTLLLDVVDGTPELEASGDDDPFDSVTAWPVRTEVTFVLDTP